MPWSLEIHHIDILCAGDSTLIVARNSDNNAVRSALIDGGRQESADAIHDYVRRTVGLSKVDVMVATHYDGDHLGGLVALLTKRTDVYDTARIYDRGWPAGDLSKYLNAIDLKSTRSRITRAVKASDATPLFSVNMIKPQGSPAIPAASSEFQLTQAVREQPQWLLDPNRREILQAVGNGAPTLTCIACNQWVLRQGKIPEKKAEGVSEAENASSLAFLLEFGQFKYYVGGDIEDAQEAGIAAYVNQANNAAGRILVMKASHHGAHTATSDSFIRRMRPLAVLVSNGLGNKHKHPAQGTVNVLNGYGRNGGAAPLPAPPGPPFRPITTYFTGYDTKDNLEETYVTAGHVAGDPTKNKRGHVVVKVAHAQANANPIFPGSVYRAVTAAVRVAAQAVSQGDYTAQAQVAAEAAVTGTMVDAACAIVNTDATRNMATALWATYCANSNGVTSDYIADLKRFIDSINQKAADVEDSVQSLMGMDKLHDVIQLAARVAQIPATVYTDFPAQLTYAATVAVSIRDFAVAFRLLRLNDFAGVADTQAEAAEKIVIDGPANVTGSALRAANIAAGIAGLLSVDGAKAQIYKLETEAKSTCKAAADAIKDLRQAYITVAGVAPDTMPTAEVAKAVTHAAGNTPLGVAAGAAAGAVFGGGLLEFTKQAVRGALAQAGIDPTAAITSLTQQMNQQGPFDDQSLFTVEYYKAAESKDVTDTLA